MRKVFLIQGDYKTQEAVLAKLFEEMIDHIRRVDRRWMWVKEPETHQKTNGWSAYARIEFLG
jgi:hypothetical protein